ncbi:hypothetical protein Clow_01589 [Corynebacterium lowii]|uniref:Uncharacterized protein n=1 Tax=Corynebacterium lowii TaxID=1544413 RepID=A0A0N8W0B5_9CORY|nr:hypothetical protein Clow_01589 [Corynebacterium lowii]MDP9852708.1 hypothetical protein [Corynebacterium lowii]
MRKRYRGTDALYTEKVLLLQADPERYFRENPKPQSGSRGAHWFYKEESSEVSR